MKRFAAPLSVLAVLVAGLSLAQTAPEALPEAPPPAGVVPGFVPLPEKIEKPYTNDKCLKKCHERPGMAVGDASGSLRNLHVDPQQFLLSIHGQKGVECIDCHVDADPNFHPRAGYTKVDCRACHSEQPPAGVFPPDALKRLEAKGIKPPPKESRKAEGWAKTAHGKAWAAKNPAAPFCSGCHTAHSIRPAKDPGSAVNRAKLSRTCGTCHPDQVFAYDAGGFLARFRIAGHGKGDLSNRYAVTECASCHQGEAAHGEETVTKQACPNCHTPPAREKREGKTVLASLHSRPLASDQPVAWLLRWAYNALVWGGGAAAGVFLLFMGFTTLYRSKDG